MKLSTALPPTLVACFLAFAACAAPERDMAADEIAALDDFEELMWVKATVADPRFDLAEELEGATLEDDQWAEFADMGRRLQLTSAKGIEFGKGAGFDAYFEQLAEQAAALETAAADRDAQRTLSLALGIKDTCKACHREYR